MKTRFAILLTLLPLQAAGTEPPHPATRAYPDAVTVCLDHGVFLNERQLISRGDEAVEQGQDAVRELFRERARRLVDNPEALEEADEIGPDLFIFARERQRFSEIEREMRLMLDEDNSVQVRLRARAERFGNVRKAWSVSATTTGASPLRVTLVNRNNTTDAMGSTPVELPPAFVFSDQGEIRFKGSGASVAIPTTLFLKTLQRARKLCES